MAKSVTSSTRTVNGNLYRSKVTENDTGGFSTELYRVESDGRETPIYAADNYADGTGTQEYVKSENISAEELAAVKDPNSALRQVHRDGVKDTESDFFGTNPSEQTKDNVNQTVGASGNVATTNPNEQNLTPNTPVENPENTPAGTQPNAETIAAAPTQQFSQNSPVPKGSPVYYPIDIAETGQDRIKFTAVELSSRTIVAPTEYTPVAGSVYISIQGPIQDQSSVSWGDSKVTAMDLSLAEVSQTTIESGGDVGAGLDKAGQLIKSALKSLDGKEAQLFSALAAKNMDIFSRGTQLTFNPNLELLFREPQLRPFNFQFKLSARSEEESKVIKKIIKYFKYHMAVKNAEGFLFLKAPDVFWIEYQKGNSNIHPSLNLIAPGEVKTKACALQSFNVDYTPLGTYMTYDDQEASMIQYNLSMNFTEITPVYQSDYDKGLGLNHSIGY